MNLILSLMESGSSSCEDLSVNLSLAESHLILVDSLLSSHILNGPCYRLMAGCSLLLLWTVYSRGGRLWTVSGDGDAKLLP
jgi:hypothetical protein